MADMTEVYEALRKANASGDTESVKKLVDYLGTQPAVLSKSAPAKRSYSAADVLPAAASNFVGSGAEFFKGVGQMIMNPLDTAKGLVDIGAGTIQNVLPESVVGAVNTTVANLKPSPSVATSAAKAIAPISPGASSLLLSFATPESGSSKQAVQAANAAGGFFKDRYGSWEGIKRTLAEDPVGAIADLSSLLGIGGAAATKVANVSKPVVFSGLVQGRGSLPAKVATTAAPVVGGLDTTGKVLSAVGKYTDPLLPAAAVVRYAGPAVGAIGGKIKDVFEPSGLKDKALANALENNVQLMDEAIKLLGQGKTIEEVAVALKNPGLASFVQESSDVNSAVQRLYNARREAISSRQTKVLTAAETQVRQQNEAAQQQATAALEAGLPVATASPTAPRRAVKQALAGEAATLEGRQAAMTSQLTAEQQAAEAALAQQRSALHKSLPDIDPSESGATLGQTKERLLKETQTKVTGPAYKKAFELAPDPFNIQSVVDKAKALGQDLLSVLSPNTVPSELGRIQRVFQPPTPPAPALGKGQVSSRIKTPTPETPPAMATLEDAATINRALSAAYGKLASALPSDTAATALRNNINAIRGELNAAIARGAPKEAVDAYSAAKQLHTTEVVQPFYTGKLSTTERSTRLGQPQLPPEKIVSTGLSNIQEAQAYARTFARDPAAMNVLKNGILDQFRRDVSKVTGVGKEVSADKAAQWLDANKEIVNVYDKAGMGLQSEIERISGQAQKLKVSEEALKIKGKEIPGKVAETFKAEDEAFKLASTTLGYKQTDKLREAIVKDPMVADMALTRMDAPARSSLARGVLQDAIKSGDASSILKHLDSNEQGIMRVLNAYDPKTAKATFAEMQKQANLLKLAEETGNQLKKVPTDNALTTAKKLNDLTSGMPEVQREVAKIQAELARGETFKELAAQGNISAKRLFSDELRPRILPLNRVMSFVNMLLTRLEGKLNEKLAVEIATEMANSNRAAEAIAAAKKQQLSKGATSKSIANAMVNPATLPAVQITNAMAEQQ